MFTPKVRFLLILLCTLLSILFASKNWWWPLVIMSLCSLSLLWGYYKNGTVYLALIKLRKNNWEASEKILSLTQRPERLLKHQQAYFYFVKGYLKREQNKFKESLVLFQNALDIGIKNENDRAMALLSMADMELVSGNKEASRNYLLKMKNLKVQPSLMPSIRKMQEWLEL